jgi:ABC-2 type transport system permease protein
VNLQHLRAFLWLRWRLRMNRLKRGGIANTIILAIVAIGAALLAGASFFIFLLVGLFALPKYSSLVILYVWDGLVIVFLFLWLVGLLAELQRSEALSLDKFLHLPVSLSGVFLLNYFSSLLSFNMILFLPAMAGLTLSLVVAKGPNMLAVGPLLVAFLFAVTAITYQFQGWLASLMTNKRRRRTILVIVTAAFVLVFQLPNLINVLQPWKKMQDRDQSKAHLAQGQAELARSHASGQITLPEYNRRLDEIRRASEEEAKESDERDWQEVGRVATLVNEVVPLGWLPLGAMASADGNVVPALLGTLGLALIGSVSLWRSYRTTLRLYSGHFTSGEELPAVAVAPSAKPQQAGVPKLERRLPWVSEHASAVALASYRGLMRAPEAKMMLLGPVILVIVFGTMALTRRVQPPPSVRPLLADAAMAMVMLTLVQLAGNQFGFDRNGFRVFVLCPARRSDILLGKNLSLAPVALGLGAGVVALLQVVYALRVDHFFAALIQLVSMYLLYCLFANLLSILAPMRISSGSLKPASPKFVPMLLHLVFVLLFLPLALAPTLLPFGTEFLLGLYGWGEGLPICLALSIVECAAIVYLYRAILTWEGGLLQMREQKILEAVVTKDE